MGKVSIVIVYPSCVSRDFTYIFRFFLWIFIQRKNHTARNQSNKAHRNGIKKARDYTAKSQKGVSIIFLSLVVR